ASTSPVSSRPVIGSSNAKPSDSRRSRSGCGMLAAALRAWARFFALSRVVLRNAPVSLGLLLRAYDDLDAAVLRAAFHRVVVADGVVRAHALRLDEILRDALGHQVVAHRLRALLRQVHVHVAGPDAVGEPEDRHRLLLAAQRVGDLVELRHRARLQLP